MAGSWPPAAAVARLNCGTPTPVNAVANLWPATGIFLEIALSDDGGRLAAGSTGSMDDTLRLWDTRNSQPIGNVVHLDSPVSAADFSPDGQILATGSDDGTIRLWDVGDQTQLGPALSGHHDE